MAYRIKVSSEAEADIYDIIDYLMHDVDGTGNPVIASRFYRDLEDVFSTIAIYAKGFALCEDSDLAKLNIRHAHLHHYKYNVYYHLEDDTIVIIDMVAHSLRNRKKILKKRKML
ncbi:type II toxin-antitoxin system RelE/ParE family toxin [Candidatus Saccharibacteria bacterium]|nr:type II toxin-antitoxin system RelE/ParE family toxin [Candidatus Saccharibacteria bacterium]